MNSPTPEPNSLEIALNRYQNALNCLDVSNIRLNQEQILEILSARDALHKQVEVEAEISGEIWSKLIKQDARLKQNTYKITSVIDLSGYQESLSISEKAWWWYLDRRESQHPFNHFDRLFKTLKLLLLGVNFTLIGTIATRFLGGGGSGWVEIGAVIFSTFISLLQTQNALTQAREKGFVRLMKWFKIKEHWYEEIQFATTMLVFLILLTILLNFPLFSELYKQQGKALQSPPENSQALPQLASAEEKYLKAIELNPDNLDAHYKLGTLYEELQDIDNAKKQYIIAAKGGFMDAYNNLSYLYIRENKDIEAEKLLEKGLGLLEQKNQQLEKLDEAEKINLASQAYHLNKNLGLTKLKQKRYNEATLNLLVGISLAKNPIYQKYIRNPGAVYCIYAQVLQEQEKKAQARQNWQECRQLLELRPSKDRNLEETQWLYEAQKQLP
jgi:tetratricopeptide (TPR) repeat protein